MITRIIGWSATHRAVIFVMALLLSAMGLWSAKNASLDAIPDLSDTQVIVFSEWMGRSADLVEDQVTWPLSRALLSTPRAKAVRGRSMFGMSFVYVIFEDGTVPDDARLGVNEILARISATLPKDVKPRLGPDASGVGWVYQYALIDPSGRLGPADLRQLQETVIRPALQSAEGVAEIATVGGYEEQIEVSVDPARMLAHGVSFDQVANAVLQANAPAGGGTIEVAGHELIIRSRAELTSLESILDAPIVGATGAPVSASRAEGGNASAATTTHIVRIRDVAHVQSAPAPRRGVADYNGMGETTGGIVVARQGGNALAVIEAVKAQLKVLQASLPEGVALVTVYDRSILIKGAVDTLSDTLLQELLVVSVIIMLFLGHVRTALVPIVVLPVAVLASFIPLRAQGITINIMSLAGFAVAVGAMVDSSILIVENVHVHLARWERRGKPGPRTAVLIESMQEVGPSAFFSLLVVGVAFVPVFALEGTEGRLFGPLAWTKTWAMMFAALLSITLAPALAVTWINKRGKTEEEDTISTLLHRLYAPAVGVVVRVRWLVLLIAAAFVLGSIPMARSIAWEFMPPLNEGSLLYMPTAPPGISEAEAARVLKEIDAKIKEIPEVSTVFGKMGRADTPTDPAPLSMAEIIIDFHPKSTWRPGLTWDDLVDELDAALQIPGMPNLWWFPVQTRVEMLSTGIRTPIGLRVEAPTLLAAEAAALKLESALRGIPGTRSIYANRAVGSFSLDVDLHRDKAAALGVTAADVANTLEGAFAGKKVSEWIDGRLRLPIVVRYARDFRSDPSDLGNAIVDGANGPVRLGLVADIVPSTAPSMIASENGRVVSYVFVDPGDITAADWINLAEQRLDRAGIASTDLGENVSYTWLGTFQSLDRAIQRLTWMIPLVLLVIAGILRINTGSWIATAIVLLSLPVSVAGGLWFIWWLDYNLSVAVLVGMIALAGVDAETGVVMLMYLRLAWNEHKASGIPQSRSVMEQAIVDGASRRLRPKLMTVTTDIIGFMPVFLVGGVGSDIMRHIAAPMVGGLAASFAVELFVYPAVFAIWQLRAAQQKT